MALSLASNNTIVGVAGSAGAIAYTITGDEATSSADHFAVLAQGLMPSSLTTLYTVPASASTIVKSIVLANSSNGSTTAALYVNGSTSSNIILPPTTIGANGDAYLGDDGWSFHDSSGRVLTTIGTTASIGTPALTLGSSNSGGVASTVVATDATIAAFDGTVPVTQAFSDVAATGSASVAARRDHRHGMPANPGGMTNPMTTTGDLIYASDNSGTPARLAAAASNFLLISRGVGIAPAWSSPSNVAESVYNSGTFVGQRPAINLIAGTNVTLTIVDNPALGRVDVTVAASGGGGGALVLVEQHTASSSASLNFTTGITSTYDEYVFELVNVLPVSGTNNLNMRVSTDGGSTWKSGTNYNYAFRYEYPSTGGDASGSAVTAFLLAGTNVGLSNLGVSGTLHLYNPLSSALYKCYVHQVIYYHDSINNMIANMGGGSYNVAADAVNAMQFYFGNGNIASGTIRLYGIAKS